MSYYSILTVTPTTDAWVADYLEPSSTTAAKYGGKFLARTASHEQVEGDAQDAALRIIIEWPSREAAMGFMNDPGYVPHFKARTEGSHSLHFLVEGKDDFAG